MKTIAQNRKNSKKRTARVEPSAKTDTSLAQVKVAYNDAGEPLTTIEESLVGNQLTGSQGDAAAEPDSEAAVLRRAARELSAIRHAQTEAEQPFLAGSESASCNKELPNESAELSYQDVLILRQAARERALHRNQAESTTAIMVRENDCSGERDLPRVLGERYSRLDVAPPDPQQQELEQASAVSELARLGGENCFGIIARALENSSPHVRRAATRALYDLNPGRAASFFNRELREGSPARLRTIGAALAASGLANDAINDLSRDNHESAYGAFSLLFLLAKSGEIRPLTSVIEDHPDIELRLTLIRLLALSGNREIIPVFDQLADRVSLPAPVRSAVLDAIYQITHQGLARLRSHRPPLGKERKDQGAKEPRDSNWCSEPGT